MTSGTLHIFEYQASDHSNMRVPQPAKFSGESANDNVEDIIFSFENYLMGNKVQRGQWPTFGMQLLSGKALSSWIAFAQPLTKKGTPPTWTQFVQVLTANFATPDRQLTARQQLFFATSQTGSVAQYLQQFRILISRAGDPPPTDKDLIVLYFKGLKQSIQDTEKSETEESRDREPVYVHCIGPLHCRLAV